MFNRCETLEHLRDRYDEFLKAFKEYRAKIPIFGAILLTADLNKVLLVQGFRSKSWGFPKGKVNQDEEEVACAVREVYEEIGYDCGHLVNASHFVESVSKQGKHIKLFIVRGVPEDFPYGPRVRKEISDIQFFKVSELPTSNQNASKRFWALQNFTPRLLRWIRAQRGKDGNRPKSRTKDGRQQQQPPQQQQQQRQQQQEEPLQQEPPQQEQPQQQRQQPPQATRALERHSSAASHHSQDAHAREAAARIPYQHHTPPPYPHQGSHPIGLHIQPFHVNIDSVMHAMARFL
mmetsp:Transcript_9031/g.22983  ORF Transcript_9031/g.22983 Transcript_9031/m.22983 type:complete len:290 (+) Transcript_9031:114-983(+)